MSLLRQCGTSKLLRQCGTSKLLVGCPASPARPLCDASQLQFLMTGPLTPLPDCFDFWSPDDDESFKAISSPDSCSVTIPLNSPGGYGMNIVGALTIDYFFDDVCTKWPYRWDLDGDIYMEASIVSIDGTAYLSYFIYHIFGFGIYGGKIKCADAVEGVPLPNNGGGTVFSGGSLTAVYA